MRRSFLALITLASLAACERASVTSLRPGAAGLSLSLSGTDATAQYLVEFKGNKLPADLAARADALGGRVVVGVDELGVAIIGGLTTDAASALSAQSDVASMLTDIVVRPERTQVGVEPTFLDGVAVDPMSVTHPEAAFFFPRQWNMRVIGADRAWAAGLLGSPDVRLAVIDAGIDPVIPDVGPLIDASRSRSFCPVENDSIQKYFPGFPTWTDLEGHGTYTASIASSRARLTAGVTSKTTLMAVKAFSQMGCSISATLQGIQFAADNGADVMNISLGVDDLVPKNELQGFAHFFHLFVQYAFRRGVSVIAVSAGNGAFDLQHSGNGYDIFCDVPGVMCVSATGPTSSGPGFLGPFVNIDAPAFYSQFGTGAIDVAAPGGNEGFDAQGHVTGISAVWAVCASTSLLFQNHAFHPTVCTGSPNFTSGALGTSAAAPHVAGLAALLVSQLGRDNKAQIRAIIEQSADDRGKPGQDPFYGSGRINVARAVGLP